MRHTQHIDGTRTAKVNLLCWILVCFGICNNLSAAHLQFNVKDIQQGALGVRTIRLQPTNATPTQYGGSIIANDAVQKTTDTSGSVTFSNIAVSSLYAVITGPNTTTPLLLSGIPVESNAVLNATNYIVPVVPSNIGRFIQAGTNILFVTNGGIITIHGTATGGGGSGGSATNAIADTYLGTTAVGTSQTSLAVTNGSNIVITASASNGRTTYAIHAPNANTNGLATTAYVDSANQSTNTSVQSQLGGKVDELNGVATNFSGYGVTYSIAPVSTDLSLSVLGSVQIQGYLDVTNFATFWASAEFSGPTVYFDNDDIRFTGLPGQFGGVLLYLDANKRLTKTNQLPGVPLTSDLNTVSNMVNGKLAATNGSAYGIRFPSGAVSNYVWACTNASTGQGEWRDAALVAGGGEANTLASVGLGWPLPWDKSGVVLRLNSITNGSGLSSSSNANMISVAVDWTQVASQTNLAGVSNTVNGKLESTNGAAYGITVPLATASRFAYLNAHKDLTNSAYSETDVANLQGATNGINTTVSGHTTDIANLQSATNKFTVTKLPTTNGASYGLTIENATASRFAYLNAHKDVTNSAYAESDILDLQSATNKAFSNKLNTTNGPSYGLTIENATASRFAYLNAHKDVTNSAYSESDILDLQSATNKLQAAKLPATNGAAYGITIPLATASRFAYLNGNKDVTNSAYSETDIANLQGGTNGLQLTKQQGSLILTNLAASTIDFPTGNIISNIAQTLYFTQQPGITVSNLVIDLAKTNRYVCRGLTNIVFTNILETAEGISGDCSIFIDNTIGATLNLRWPAYGAQHGYYFGTNVASDVLGTTTVASGGRRVVTISFFGTNLQSTITSW